MSNRPNTRWGARQPPRRGGGSGNGASGYDQNYEEYNYGHQQYPASGYEYETYEQSQPGYERGTGSKRYSSNRTNHDANNYYYNNNPPPRHAKGNTADTSSNSKSNASVSKKPTKRDEAEPTTPPVLTKERAVVGNYSLTKLSSYLQAIGTVFPFD